MDLADPGRGADLSGRLLAIHGDCGGVAPAPSVSAAPDGGGAVVFSHGCETTMMDYRYRVALLGGDGVTLTPLEPLRAVHPVCAWSPDSRRCALPIAPGGEACLVLEPAAARFAVIPVSTRRYRVAFTAPTVLRLECDPEQLAALNVQEVFGGGHAQMPIARYRACDPRLVAVATLAWHPRERLADLAALAAALPTLDLEPVADGWHPFTGTYPASTVACINGRQLEIFHLEAFAAHGDTQSRRWLEEIVARTGGRGVSRWDQVSRHLGKRLREGAAEIAPPARHRRRRQRRAAKRPPGDGPCA